MDGLGRSGFSLITVVVSSAVLLIVTLGVAKFLAQTLKAKRGVASGLEAENLNGAVNTLLHVTDLCRCNLTPSVAPGPYTFSEANAATTSIAIAELQIFDTIGGACDPSGFFIAQVGQAQNDIEVTSIEMNQFTKVNNDLYYARLNLSISRGGVPYPKRKAYNVALETNTAGGVVTLVDCFEPGGGVLSSVEFGAGVTSASVTIEEPGILIGTAHAQAVHSEGSVAFRVNGGVCAYDSKPTGNSNMSATCVKSLAPGTYNLEIFYNNGASVTLTGGFVILSQD